MKKLLKEIKDCTVCKNDLPFGCRPIATGTSTSRILIIGQAPGSRVHASGIPWDDASGKNLRAWMGIDAEQFYDTSLISIMPMGFCYPGTGKSGDMPPRKECAPLWHEKMIQKMPNIELILLIGNYAQKYYLGKAKKKNLTTTVQAAYEYFPLNFPLPHPSPRDNIWQKKNPWFKEDILPILAHRIATIIKKAEQK